MIDQTVKQALIRMGYRPMKNGEVWGKPLAYQLYLAKEHEGKWEITNYFKGFNGKIHVWARCEFKDEETLKFAEMSVDKLVLNGINTDFGFETQEKMFDSIL